MSLTDFTNSFEDAVLQLIQSCQCVKCGQLKNWNISEYVMGLPRSPCEPCDSSDPLVFNQQSAVLFWMSRYGVNYKQLMPGETLQQTAARKYPHFIQELHRVIDICHIPVFLDVVHVKRIRGIISMKETFDFVGEYTKRIHQLKELCGNLSQRTFNKLVKNHTMWYLTNVERVCTHVTQQVIRKNNKQISKVWKVWFMETEDYTQFVQWLPREMMEDVALLSGKPENPDNRIIRI